MYILGGENVYFVEVEVVFMSYFKVFEVVVIGIFFEKWGELGVVILVKDDDLVIGDEIFEFV